MSFLKGLQLLLIALYLTGHIDWAWWELWAPLMANYTITMVCVLSKNKGLL